MEYQEGDYVDVLEYGPGLITEVVDGLVSGVWDEFTVSLSGGGNVVACRSDLTMLKAVG